MRIGIEITFNDDFNDNGFSKELKALKSREQYKQIFGAMIMVRLAEYVSGKRRAERGESTPAQDAFLKAVFANPPTLFDALSAVREALGASPKARVLLCVDELTKYWDVDEATKLSPLAIEALKALCAEMDASGGLLVLSVTGYGLLDIQNFATGSNRRLCLQPLPPVFPMAGLPEAVVGKLPSVLQAFAKEDTRQQLWYGSDHLELYALLSRTLAATGGHPRRVHDCLECMRALPSPELNRKGPQAFYRFTDEACAMIKALCAPPPSGGLSQIERLMNSTLSFVVAVQTFLRDYLWLFTAADRKQFLYTTAKRDQFFRGIANPYEFPNDAGTAKWHSGMLQGSCLGVCQFCSGFTFVPFPALVPSAEAKRIPGEAPSPLQAQCHAAVKALVAYQNDTKSEGKPFEELWARVLHFVLNCRENTTLTELVGKCGDASGFKKKVHCGKVRWIDRVTTFPCYFKQSGLLQLQCETHEKTEHWLRQQLKDNEDGFMFIPTEQFNLASDFVAVLRVDADSASSEPAPGEGLVQPAYILVSFQAKGWFKETASNVHCFDDFRWGQQFYRSESVMHAKHNGSVIDNPFLSIKLKELGITETLHVLLTANPIKLDGQPRCSGMSLPPECEALLRKPEILSDEALADLSHMVAICPSFGFAARGAHTLRELFVIRPKEEGLDATAAAESDPQPCPTAIPEGASSSEVPKPKVPIPVSTVEYL